MFSNVFFYPAEKADGEEQKSNGKADASEAKDADSADKRAEQPADAPEARDGDSEDKLAEQLGDLSVKDAAGGDTSKESDKKDTEKTEKKD